MMRKRLIVLMCVLAVAAAVIQTGAAAAPNSSATITAVFADGCTDFDVDSSKDISNIVIYYADGTSEKIEFSDAEQGRTYSYRGDRTITAIDVKSGTTVQRFTCQPGPTPTPTPTGEPGKPQCTDDVDNDGDGLIDQADPGCTKDDDDDESA